MDKIRARGFAFGDDYISHVTTELGLAHATVMKLKVCIFLDNVDEIQPSEGVDNL